MTSKSETSIYGLLFFIILISLSSCKKEELIVLTDEDMLTTGTWKKTAVISTPPIVLDDGTVINDLLNLEPSCILDNILTFTTEGEHYYSEGANVCSWNNQVSETGEWRIQHIDGEKMLDFNYNRPNSSHKLKIVSLDENKLVLEYQGSLRLETSSYEKVRSSVN